MSSPPKLPYMAGMAKPLPMPVELVVDHPAFIAAPTAARHMIRAITIAFWRSECRELPTGTGDLIRLCETDIATWRRHGRIMLTILAVIKGDLTDRRDTELEKAAERLAKARRAAIASNRAQGAVRVKRSPHYPPPEPPASPIQAPARARRYQDANIDMKARGDAATRSAGIVRGNGSGLLVDSGAPDPIAPSHIAGAWTWKPTDPPAPTSTD